MKKLLPSAHWEKMKGTIQQNIVYCSKGGEVLATTEDLTSKEERILAKRYSQVVWKAWQQQAIEIVEGPEDLRSIHWFYDPVGNKGKSYLCRYLYCKYPCIIVNGKTTDIFNSIKNFMDEKKIEPKAVLVDVPRESFQYLNYSTLEKIKDGLFYSGKYEGGNILFENIPHILVFANHKPSDEAYSADRLKVITVTG
jgi:hypothetical protein